MTNSDHVRLGGDMATALWFAERLTTADHWTLYRYAPGEGDVVKATGTLDAVRAAKRLLESTP
jgi:hypothetical protein